MEQMPVNDFDPNKEITNEVASTDNYYLHNTAFQTYWRNTSQLLPNLYE